MAELVLPSDLFRYFVIVKIEQSFNLFRIHQDEKMIKEISDEIHIKSKGFMDGIKVLDFYICNYKVDRKSVV